MNEPAHLCTVCGEWYESAWCHARECKGPPSRAEAQAWLSRIGEVLNGRTPRD
jgi:hypothetical protein